MRRVRVLIKPANGRNHGLDTKTAGFPFNDELHANELPLLSRSRVFSGGEHEFATGKATSTSSDLTD